MSLVIDASALTAALTDGGEDGRWAEGLLVSGGLIAPHLLIVETTSVLRRLELSKQLSSVEAGSAAKDLLHLDIELLPFEPFARRIWELRENISSYDAWYVAVAEAFGAPLATLDAKLARSPGPRCRFLRPAHSPRR